MTTMTKTMVNRHVGMSLLMAVLFMLPLTTWAGSVDDRFHSNAKNPTHKLEITSHFRVIITGGDV